MCHRIESLTRVFPMKFVSFVSVVSLVSLVSVVSLCYLLHQNGRCSCVVSSSRNDLLRMHQANVVDLCARIAAACFCSGDPCRCPLACHAFGVATGAERRDTIMVTCLPHTSISHE